MEIPDSLQCLFTARTERRDGEVVIEIPESEIQNGSVSAGEVYQIALLARTGQAPSTPDSEASASVSDQPVQEGDVLEVEIEDIGDQGDGIARVGPGFVVIVPETKPGDRVTIKITDVGQGGAWTIGGKLLLTSAVAVLNPSVASLHAKWPANMSSTICRDTT